MLGFIIGLMAAFAESGAGEDIGWIFYILLPALAVPAALIALFANKKAGQAPSFNSGILSALKGMIIGDPARLFKEGSLRKMIHDAGYAYDAKQDIFYTHMYPWQRKFGYCRLYDEASPPLRMIFDCEPIYFQYANKKWLIEFWKGQYGITSGCEIGVYYTDKLDLNIPGVFNGTFYECVEDADTLPMSLTLYKNGKKLFSRKAKHWWLTGFVLGEYSEPSELTMHLSITFKNAAMRAEFVKGLKKAGYTGKEIKIKGNTVSLVFDKPKTRQPYSRTKETEASAQKNNKYYCELYRELTQGYGSTPDKLAALRENNPDLFKSILSFGKPKEVFSAYNLLKEGR